MLEFYSGPIRANLWNPELRLILKHTNEYKKKISAEECIYLPGVSYE